MKNKLFLKPAVVAEWSKALSDVHTSVILRSQVRILLGACLYGKKRAEAWSSGYSARLRSGRSWVLISVVLFLLFELVFQAIDRSA